MFEKRVIQGYFADSPLSPIEESIFRFENLLDFGAKNK
jgi:hypothetical protein